jgi:serine/threonine-protein kinase HipA
LLSDNERTLDTWGRQFQVSARNPAALLACVGEDCAGAVQFVREERLDEVLTTARGDGRALEELLIALQPSMRLAPL